jgi:adiponectin receptor
MTDKTLRSRTPSFSSTTYGRMKRSSSNLSSTSLESLQYLDSATVAIKRKNRISWHEQDSGDERDERHKAVVTADNNKAWKEGRWPKLKLYSRKEIPKYLQDNEFIYGSYRAYYSFNDNWRSFFMLHNESVNVWSHTFGFLAFVAISVYAAMNFPKGSHLFDLVAFTCYFISAVICLGFSSLFHLHFCHSKQAYVTFGCLDYAGISTLICGSCCLVTYLLFYCQTVPRVAWLTATILLASVGIIGPLHPEWATQPYRKVRTLVYLSSAITSACPILHYVLLHGWPQGIDVTAYHAWAAMTLLYLIGATVYAMRVPEAWWPGKFDLFLSSHQWWHACVVGACYAHYMASWRLLEWRVMSAETCSP